MSRLALVFRPRLTLLLILFVLFPATVFAGSHATILAYHHVSDKTPPSTTISPEKFKEHLAYLAANHNVLALDKIIHHIKNDIPLPDKAVAITFDDGFRNIMENGHPLLQEYSFPYTIFVNPDSVGKTRSHLNWQELKTLSEQGVLIANHYWDHRHLLADVTTENWQEVTRKNILKAEKAIVDNIGYSPAFLAYPFGEYNLEIQHVLKNLGVVGFAQHSGALTKYSDFAAIPRFPAAGIYSNLKTLKTKLSSLAMPVIKSSIPDPAFYQAPEMEFTLEVDTSDFHTHLFACYFKGDRVETQWDGDKVVISSDNVLRPGRSRTNCTAPSKKNPGRYYWYSQPVFVATEEGNWLD